MTFTYLLPSFAKRCASLVGLWAWTPNTHLRIIYPLTWAAEALRAAVVGTVSANADCDNRAALSSVCVDAERTMSMRPMAASLAKWIVILWTGPSCPYVETENPVLYGDERGKE